MKKYTIRQYVELFHLLFLQQFSLKIDKHLYALKGGCNLRFFFNSIRYSEDIDFDIQIIEVNTLAQKVRRILNSQPFMQILNSRGISIVKVSEPKQTATTQRWKLILQANHIGIPLNTKIEFSRRGLNPGITFEAMGSEITRYYQLQPLFVNHYCASAALAQKIAALVLRTQLQARDVFDIKLLLNLGAQLKHLPKKIKQNVLQAQDRAMSISFNDFKGQVVAYLAPEYQVYYDSPKIWDEIVSSVVDELEKINR